MDFQIHQVSFALQLIFSQALNEVENWVEDMGRTSDEIALFDNSVLEQRLPQLVRQSGATHTQAQDLSGRAHDIMTRIEQSGENL